VSKPTAARIAAKNAAEIFRFIAVKI